MPQKVCFISLYSYSLFNRKTNFGFGGSEVRSWLLANGLSRRAEFDVSFVVFHHGQPRVEQYERVTVYRQNYRPFYAKRMSRYMMDLEGRAKFSRRYPFVSIYEKSLPVFWKVAYVFVSLIFQRIGRFLELLLTSPVFIKDYEIPERKLKVYQKVDADIYCVFGAHEVSAELAVFCLQNHKKLLLFAGSDIDFSEAYYEDSQETLQYGRKGFLCYYALEKANEIITQTKNQALMLKQRFNKTAAAVITNPIDLSVYLPEIAYEKRKTALWIGKSDHVKRPDIVIRLAKRFAEVQFVVVMNPSSQELYRNILSDCPPNVRLIDYVPFHQVEEYFSDAFVLINTSVFEGFPNTFLQAGKYGVPLLSMSVDPDGFIAGEHCGIVAGEDFEKLSDGLKLLLSDPARAREYSENIRKYVCEHHDLEDKIDQLTEVLGKMASDPGAE